jgi:hypothetical protein
MPHVSIWPFALGVALLGACYGVLFDAWPVASGGGVAIAVCVAGWFWPRGETQET